MRETSESITYIRELFAPESAVCRQANARVQQAFPNLHHMQIGAEEGKLLQLLVTMANVKTVVEIGSFAGYSALWMAEILPEDGIIHCLNKDLQHNEILLKNIETYQSENPAAASIELHAGDAREKLQELQAQGPFDMVFIDADKLNYAHYLDWAEQHVRKGGLIVGDNTLLFNHVWKDQPPEGKGTPSKSAWEAMRAFNARLADTEKYLSTLIPTVEGMTVAIKLF